ncbi:hypothetical protein DPEC_G00291430 [Dallia pectoralis]|uniref:Uncharacterized protein n=1 Tax=Dallia pectoralis TaxID=75939 RepID=A0ACC2FHQ9_DALPE|nr:hypothetical protein DPEC_G00291430 [Dallia pectoralis]
MITSSEEIPSIDPFLKIKALHRECDKHHSTVLPTALRNANVPYPQCNIHKWVVYRIQTTCRRLFQLRPETSRRAKCVARNHAAFPLFVRFRWSALVIEEVLKA